MCERNCFRFHFYVLGCLGLLSVIKSFIHLYLTELHAQKDKIVGYSWTHLPCDSLDSRELL